jgi:hypothetical protein
VKTKHTHEQLTGKHHGSQYSRRKQASIDVTAAGGASLISWTENRQQTPFNFILASESVSISYFHALL